MLILTLQGAIARLSPPTSVVANNAPAGGSLAVGCPCHSDQYRLVYHSRTLGSHFLNSVGGRKIPSAGPTVLGAHFCTLSVTKEMPSVTKEISQEGHLSSFTVMFAPQAGQRLWSAVFVGDVVTFSIGLGTGSGCCVSHGSRSAKRKDDSSADRWCPSSHCWLTSSWSNSESIP